MNGVWNAIKEFEVFSGQKVYIFDNYRLSFIEIKKDVSMNTINNQTDDDSISLVAKLGFSMILYALFAVAYLTANRLIDINRCHSLTTTLDNLTPFIPAFIIPYLFIYVFTLLPALIIKSRKVFLKTITGGGLLIIASATIFVIYPVHVPRPPEIPAGFLGWIFNSLHWVDKPVCGFPSLHVGITLFPTLIVFRENRKWGWFFVVMAILTFFSTLLTKQHVIYDVLGGIFMAFLMDWLVMKNGYLRIMSICRTVFDNIRQYEAGS